jgi:hypothetical protein
MPEPDKARYGQPRYTVLVVRAYVPHQPNADELRRMEAAVPLDTEAVTGWFEAADELPAIEETMGT